MTALTTAFNSRMRGQPLRFRFALWLMLMHALVEVHAADPVEVSLVAEVRADVEISPGRHLASLVPATVLRQGQEIFYTVRIRNSAATALRDVEVTQQIPQNTAYVPYSAGGPNTQVSVSADGGQTFAAEGQLTMVDQSASALMQAASFDREALTRPATAQDYTHIRWRLRYPLAPGAVALARFRAVFQ
jgi:uncharacterized repeat protein (TIGR01451 family)